MALIHQMLYQQEQLSKINFREYLQKLVEAISDSYMCSAGNVQCHMQCEPVELDIDTAIPLGLIANELLVNAFKYAFGENDQGAIRITLGQAEKNKFALKIKDNGRGLPGNFNMDQATTLGLKLVYLLVKQLRGEIQYKVNKGAEFTIFFEESSKK